MALSARGLQGCAGYHAAPRVELTAENVLSRQQLIVAARKVKRPAFRRHEGALLTVLAAALDRRAAAAPLEAARPRAASDVRNRGTPTFDVVGCVRRSLLGAIPQTHDTTRQEITRRPIRDGYLPTRHRSRCALLQFDRECEACRRRSEYVPTRSHDGCAARRARAAAASTRLETVVAKIRSGWPSRWATARCYAQLGADRGSQDSYRRAATAPATTV